MNRYVKYAHKCKLCRHLIKTAENSRDQAEQGTSRASSFQLGVGGALLAQFFIGRSQSQYQPF